jgi:hypothetical protein
MDKTLIPDAISSSFRFNQGIWGVPAPIFFLLLYFVLTNISIFYIFFLTHILYFFFDKVYFVPNVSRKNCMGVVLGGTSRMIVLGNSTVLRAALVELPRYFWNGCGPHYLSPSSQGSESQTVCRSRSFFIQFLTGADSSLEP